MPEPVAAEPGGVEGLEAVARRRIAAVSAPPSRLKWFGVGAIVAAIVGWPLGWVAIRLPPLGMGLHAKGEIRLVSPGMSYDEALLLMGPEDGELRAAELASFDEHLCSYCSPSLDYAATEAKGGRFPFWLSRSEGLLVFNVVAVDGEGKVILPIVTYATFHGRD